MSTGCGGRMEDGPRNGVAACCRLAEQHPGRNSFLAKIMVTTASEGIRGLSAPWPALVSRRLLAIVERMLWWEICVSRALQMVSTLTKLLRAGARARQWWMAGAREAHLPLLQQFRPPLPVAVVRPGPVVVCVGPVRARRAVGGGGGQDLGAYRGVFRGFIRSRKRACLLGGRARLEPRACCPCWDACVWTVTPPRSARRCLDMHDGRVEYFVCLRSHLQGSCWLAYLFDCEGERNDGFDSLSHNDGFGAVAASEQE